MKGLLLNGYYCFWEYAKVTMFIFGLMGLFVLVTGSPTAQEMTAYLLTTSLPMNAILASKNDDISKWNRYELVLPVRRDEIVKSKYLAYLGWTLAGVLVSFLFAGLTTIVHSGANISGDITKIYSEFALAIGLAIFAGGLFYPLSYYIGMDKSDPIMLVSFLLSTGVTVFLVNVLNVYISSFLVRMSIFVGIYMVFFAFSYVLSKSIYKKMEV